MIRTLARVAKKFSGTKPSVLVATNAPKPVMLNAKTKPMFKAGKSLDRVKVIQSGKVFRVTLAGVTYKGTKQQIQKLIYDFNEGIMPTNQTATHLPNGEPLFSHREKHQECGKVFAECDCEKNPKVKTQDSEKAKT